jgi:hypothetical protein
MTITETPNQELHAFLIASQALLANKSLQIHRSEKCLRQKLYRDLKQIFYVRYTQCQRHFNKSE